MGSRRSAPAAPPPPPPPPPPPQPRKPERIAPEAVSEEVKKAPGDRRRKARGRVKAATRIQDENSLLGG
jgi:hypothetical protein